MYVAVTFLQGIRGEVVLATCYRLLPTADVLLHAEGLTMVGQIE